MAKKIIAASHSIGDKVLRPDGTWIGKPVGWMEAINIFLENDN